MQGGGALIIQLSPCKQALTPDAKLTAGEPNQLSLSLRPCFAEASLTVWKTVLC